jgi:hypothetical protein
LRRFIASCSYLTGPIRSGSECEGVADFGLPSRTHAWKKEQLSLFGGGKGDSFEAAVVVNAHNSLDGVEAEYAYIANQCGEHVPVRLEGVPHA